MKKALIMISFLTSNIQLYAGGAFSSQTRPPKESKKENKEIYAKSSSISTSRPRSNSDSMTKKDFQNMHKKRHKRRATQ